jgi:hypothetical protein
MKTCKWLRAFDGHFNISCVNETKQRANGEFKSDTQYKTAEWDFKFCPYCGGEIIVEEPPEED